jgi:hypothetical protein
MEMEFDAYFNEFAAYAKEQGATDEEIQEMKVGPLDTIFEELFEIKELK